MSIEITYDFYGLRRIDGDVVVNSNKDYLEACERIEEAIKKTEDLKVIVENKAMRRWFDQFKKNVVFHPLEPVHLLAKNLGCKLAEIPEQLRLNQILILEEKLIELSEEKPKKIGQSVTSWILSHRVDPIWGEEVIYISSNLSRLINSILSEKTTNQTEFISSLITERHHTFSAKGKYRDLLKWLFEGDPTDKAMTVILARAITKYPAEVRTRALSFDNRGYELSKLKVELLDNVDLSSTCVINPPLHYSYEVKSFLESSINSCTLDSMLEYISGFLLCESEVVKKYFETNKSLIDDTWIALIDRAIERFIPWDSNEALIEFLRQLRPVPSPVELKTETGWDEVEHWLTKEYFPFYLSCLYRGSIENTYKQINEFKKWLTNNYSNLVHKISFAPLLFKKLIQECLNKEKLLVIIIDGLSYYYCDYIKRILSGYDLYCKHQPALSTIPSTTEIAKQSLLAGQLYGFIDNKSESRIDYKSLLSNSLGVPSNKISLDLSNRISLDEIYTDDIDIYLYMINDIDKIIHDKRDWRIRDNNIKEILKSNLEKACKVFLNIKNKTRKNVSMIIASDHGFTEIPMNAEQVDLPKDVQQRASHSRFLEVGQEETYQSEKVFRIPNTWLCSNEQNFYVADGYCYFGSRPSATHGGVTPQELIVPVIRVTEKLEVGKIVLDVSAKGEVKRRSKENRISLRIFNPSEFEVILQSVRLGDQICTDLVGRSLEANEIVESELSIDASSINTETQDFELVYTLECRGELSEQKKVIRFKTIGAALIDEDFEKEFE